MKSAPQISPYGIKQGSFSVDANGAAGYHLPIEIPPGIAGVQPRLSLDYNHRQGNGICGVGWTLSGLSAITRTNAIMAIDNYCGAITLQDTDKLALDGERLVNISGEYGQPGTIYYTEIHTWKQIVAGADGGFTVYMKNGEIWSYGTTADSCIMAQGTDAVRVWALHSIQDLNGNMVEYQYTTDPGGNNDNVGAYYVSAINYTITGDTGACFSIVFGYDNRTDVITTYQAGALIQTNYLLSNISVLMCATLIRTYTLEYEISTATQLNRLNNIIVSDSDGNSLPAIQFQWQDVASPSFDTNQPATQWEGSSVVQTIPADVNGDGITDIMQFYLDADNCLNVATYLSQNNNGTITYTPSQELSGLLGYYSGASYGSQYAVYVGDVNGDGINDIIVAYAGGEEAQFLCFDVYLNSITGISTAYTTTTGDEWVGNASFGFYPMDINGNGLIDMVQVFSDTSGNLNINGYPSAFNTTAMNFGATYYYNTNQPYNVQSIWPADVNGDGIIDLIVLWEESATQDLNTTSFITVSTADQLEFMSTSVSSSLNNTQNGQITILPVDVNGDGMTDILQISEDNGTFTLQSFYSMGNGGFAAGLSSSFNQQQYTSSQLYSMNVNGAAQTNIVATWLDEDSNLNFTVYSASPSGLFTQGSIVNTGQQLPVANFYVGDVDGSGKASFIYTYADENQISVQPFISQGAYPDMVNNITDQLGNCVAITYAPLTDSSVYWEDVPVYPTASTRRYPCSLSPAQYPMQQVIGRAMYVVSGYSMYNDAASNRFSYSQAYELQYTNAYIDLNGRGWMGFGSKQVLDLNTGLMSVENFVQSFPYTGYVAKLSKYADGKYSKDPKVPADAVVLLSAVVNTYLAAGYAGQGADAGTTAYDVQHTSKLSYYYDYGEENFDFLVAQSFGYDDYGNQDAMTWWGYADYLDPAGINSIGVLPSITPLAQDEIVYHYRAYLNQELQNGWVLGYMLYEKQSANSSDANIATFNAGDYNLSACTYNDGTFTLASQAAWDDQNNCMLVTSFTYDKFGNKLSETGPDGSVTTYTYETTCNTYVDTITTPANAQGVSLTSAYGFDPRFGIQVARIDANGSISIIGLDSFGRKVAEQGPVPPGCSQSDPNQCTTFVTGSPAFQSASVLTLNSFSYLTDEDAGIYMQRNVLQQFPGDASRVCLSGITYVDGLNREVVVATEAAPANGYTVVSVTYDSRGNILSKSLPFFGQSLTSLQAQYLVNYTYDVLGRILMLTSPSGEDSQDITTTAWNYAAGQQVTAVSAQGAQEQYTQVITNHLFNNTHQQTQSVIVTDSNATTTFNYDALGRLVQTIDPQDIANNIVYDALSRKLSYDNPDQNLSQAKNASALTYQYAAANGKVQTITDASGSSVTYTYDALGRIAAQAFSDGRVYKFTYDTAVNGAMKISEVAIYAQGGAVESGKVYSYDVYGNTAAETLTIGADSYNTSSVFDPVKRCVSQTYNDGSTIARQYQYGLLVSQQLGDVTLSYPLADYTADGNYTQSQYLVGNNTILTAGYNYNAMGLVYGETLLNSANASLLDFSFDFDQLNQLTSSAESISNTAQSYAYQNKRLMSVAGSGSGMPAGSYTYDTGSRLMSKDGNTYAYNNSNFPVSITGKMAYSATQDNCGRMTSRTVNGNVLNFSYDADNNLMAISAAGKIIRSMLYNESGRRVQETIAGDAVTTFVSSAYKCTVGVDGTTTITKYMHDQLGPVVSIATTGEETVTLLFRRDQKGNITHMYDTSGVLQASFAYDGFGMPTVIQTSPSAVGAPQYEGRALDLETGLFYFGARYYDPVTGTFLTPDSRLGGKHKLVAGAWNRFSFELNNPVNHIDPSGHLSLWAKIGIGVGLVLLTAAAIALTPVTGGASDAAVAAFDGSVAGSVGVESASAGIEMADLSATAVTDAAADAGADAGVDAVADGGGREAAQAILRAVARVAIRAGVNAAAGGLTGAMSGAGIGGLTYLIEGGNSGSGVLSAMENGALTGLISGAVSGAVAGELTAAVNFSKYSTFTCIIIKGGISAAGDVAGEIAQSEIIDHQFPTISDLAETAAQSFFTGALFSDESIAAAKKYYYFRFVVKSLNKNNEIGIEMTEMTKSL